MGTRQNRLAEAILTNTHIYVLSRNLKNIRISYLKIFIFGGKIFSIFESACFHNEGGPGVSLTLCCFVVYSTRLFVVCLSVCHFVLVFFSPFSIAIISLGEERANLSAFHTFVRLVLV